MTKKLRDGERNEDTTSSSSSSFSNNKNPSKSNVFQLTFRSLGPGIITGASDDDPSGIATYSQAGAKFGLGMLWMVIFLHQDTTYSCKGQQSRVLGTDYHISTFLCGPYLQIYDGTANSCSRERRLPGIHRRHICDSHQAFPKHSCKYGPYDHLMGSLSPKPFYGSISCKNTFI